MSLFAGVPLSLNPMALFIRQPQATITDVRDFQALVQHLFNNHLMEPRISRIRKAFNLVHTKEVSSDVGKYEFSI